jgi:amphi-Trp domain-containing protein
VEFEHEVTERVSREEAAERLRELADQLARHNEVSFRREGTKFSIDVPDEVELSVEIEISDGECEIEVEISW